MTGPVERLPEPSSSNKSQHTQNTLTNIMITAAVRSARVGATATKAISRSSHTLVVPHVHEPVTSFESGIPTTQVRELQAVEKGWNCWSTSQALFLPHNPSLNGLVFVPVGETWVTKSKSVLKSGWHFVLPLLNSVKAVKSTKTIAMGVNAAQIQSKSGSVDAYVVAYLTVTDPLKSAFYTDASGRVDSEAVVPLDIQRILSEQVAAGASKDAVVAAVTKELAAKEAEYGLKLDALEVRGIFPSSANILDKIRALEEPLRTADTAGHGLAADYWAESLTPPYFESFKFGSRYEAPTPAAHSLEWAIPSPPDYHHFNEVPKLTVSADQVDSKH